MKDSFVRIVKRKALTLLFAVGRRNTQTLLQPLALRAGLITSILLQPVEDHHERASQLLSGGRMQADSVSRRIEQVLSPLAEGSVVQSEKCGFRFQSEVQRYWEFFSPSKRTLLQALLSRPELQTSVLSPMGYFRVHYDTIGINTPFLLDKNGDPVPGSARAYVDSVAQTFDHVWQFETQFLGYPPPPEDRGKGGGNEYDIYILEFSGSIYGLTNFDEENIMNPHKPNPSYSSFIEIDNDFRGYFSAGVEGLKVTAAHELYHAIQIGNYGLWADDIYYYELTSTWMEDVVYDEVNDYYQWLPHYFRNTSLPFNLSNGFIEYGRSLWGKFIEKRFGRNLMKRSWEHISTVRTLRALDVSLREVGTSFVRELSEFSVWLFYTGWRADPTRYFSEGRAYPEIRIIDRVMFIPPTATISSSSRALSLQFYQLLVDRGLGNLDTVSVALTNINLAAVERSEDRIYGFSYRFTTGDIDGPFESLRNGLKVKFVVSDPMNWKSITFLNSEVDAQDKFLPYPNPFVAGKSGGIVFPVRSNQPMHVTLNIYSSSFDLVWSKTQDTAIQFGKQVILWDGKDTKGSFVPSGIYVYYIITKESEYKGKTAVVRE